ncbi:MAG: hypothetical protein JEZ02_06530 [Desulfatibacillum sp.]|nr:hypothetical protein [Desulfatibacillum sp.]
MDPTFREIPHKNSIMENNMPSMPPRIVSALMAVFPTPGSFHQFAGNSENTKALASFTSFAAQNGILETDEVSSFEKFVAGNARPKEACKPPYQMNFGDFFDQKETLLELNISVRALTDRINALLDLYGIDLPRVGNSMLSRLKKEKADTTHKQNVLRSLAFWLGHDRGHLGPQWNYETLMELCRGGRQQVDHKEGVRIGFALYSRGDVIDHETVGWLKGELKGYIQQSIGRFVYGKWGKVRSHDITTLYVDLPKEEQVSNPASYRQCLRSALSLAHQIAIRWALSKYYSQNRFLSIGVAAGNFDSLDNYLLPILNAKLPGDPAIRLTDYARQCALINDIRALLCPGPAEITLFNDEALTIWWVVGVWSTLYFDFIPDLLKDKTLQNDPASTTLFFTTLYPSVVSAQDVDGGDQPNALSTFLRFPHNSLLGLEIAKTLYYRRRFWDANEILRIILSLNPTHLNARTLRMVLLRNLALDAPSYAIAEGMFEQAHLEAAFILENCAFLSEDFYCEHAVLFLAQAMTTLRYLRKGNGAIEGEANADHHKRKIFAGLEKADSAFMNGMTVSPTGVRANYLLNSVKVIKSVLKNDDRIFSDPNRPVDGPPSTVRKPIYDLQWQLGYLREDLPQTRPYELMENVFKLYTEVHDDSISLQAYRPTTYYCTAVVWWDLFPERTVACARRTIRLLEGAADLAREMDKKDVCIYAFTRTYGEMIPAQEFVRHIEKMLRVVHAYVGADLSARKSTEVIEPPDGKPMNLLMTLNF